MRRLALETAARTGRRETARLLRRPVRRRGRTTRLVAGYAACAALALVAATVGRLPTEAPTLPGPGGWARPAPAEIAPAPAPPPPTAWEAASPNVRVVDGDTLVVAGERVRIVNVDTPEMPPKARCAAEADGAFRARDHLQALVASGPVRLERTGEDRYGRTLAYVSVDGADAGRALVAAGLARPWEGRRRSWCA